MAGERLTAPPELVAFAFVEQDYVESGGDISVGFMRLFAPILATNVNRIFEPKEFAAEVERRFDIPMRPIVAAGLVEKLFQAKLLVQDTEGSHVYRIAPQRERARVEETKDVDALLDDYVKFANTSLEAVGGQAEDSLIADSFFRQIVTLDFLSFLNRPDRDHFRGNTLKLNGGADDEVEGEFNIEQVLQVICAEFVLDLMKRNPERFAILEKIVSGVLIKSW